jgi:hypothetical protein
MIDAQGRQYTGRAFGSMDEVYKQIETLRAIALSSNSDGSLAFFDMRVERKWQA